MLPDQSSSQISWIGSLQGALLVFIGIFTGPLFDRGFSRRLVMAGTICITIGLMMTSLCTSYWQLLLAQGIMVGLGCGCLFVPCVAIIPSYFSTKRALAQGLATSGSSLGAVIYSIVFQQLQPRIGFGWTTRIIGFMAFVTLLLPVICMRQKGTPQSARKLFDWQPWKEPTFFLFTTAQLFSFMALYIPFFYIQLYAYENRYVDQNLIIYLLTFLNAGSLLGRIVGSLPLS